MSNNNNKEVVPPKLSQSNEAAQRAFRARSRAIKKGIRQGRVEKYRAEWAEGKRPQPPRTSERLESRHHISDSYVISAHGCMIPERFTVPGDKRIVFMTPPACTTWTLPTAIFLENFDTVSKLLDPQTTSLTSMNGQTHYIHHIAPGEDTQDLMLYFRNDIWLSGIYKLPLHPDVFLLDAGRNHLYEYDESSSLRVQASANRHRVMKDRYNKYNIIKEMKLSTLLSKLGPGVYAVAACRSCTDVNTNTNFNTSRNNPYRLAAGGVGTIPREYHAEIRNFQHKSGLSNHDMRSVSLRGGTKGDYSHHIYRPQQKQHMEKRFENIRKRVEAQEYIPSRSAVSLLIRNSESLRNLAKNGKLQNYNHKTGKHT